MRASLLLLVVLLGSGCLKRVPESVIEKLPYEARIELLEAENDLALAIDRLDEVQSEKLRTREQIRRAKDRLSAAEKETSAASDTLSREVAELAVYEGDARVEFLRARQQVNNRDEAVLTQGLKCANARFELARLLAARKAKLEGSEGLDPADFEAQVKDCEAKFAELKLEMKETQGEADALKATWDLTREKLAKKTFDARASPYVE